MPWLISCIWGFIWPWYVYIRGGNVNYHPGVIWDRDFSDFAVWYFENKVFSKKFKYWNMDHYLDLYFTVRRGDLAFVFEETTTTASPEEEEKLREMEETFDSMVRFVIDRDPRLKALLEDQSIDQLKARVSRLLINNYIISFIWNCIIKSTLLKKKWCIN